MVLLAPDFPRPGLGQVFQGHTQGQSTEEGTRLKQTVRSVACGEGYMGVGTRGHAPRCRTQVSWNVTARSSVASTIVEGPQRLVLGAVWEDTTFKGGCRGVFCPGKRGGWTFVC